MEDLGLDGISILRRSNCLKEMGCEGIDWVKGRLITGSNGGFL
jgi:hypothetical protein